MSRKNLFIFIAVIIIIFTFFNPFGSIKDLQNSIPKPKVNPEEVQPVADYLVNNYKTPEDFVLDAFKDHDIVFLGEFWKIKQNMEFVSQLIPLLYARGIMNLGVEFALYADQEKLDALLTDAYYYESWAQDLLFDYLVIWGYKEYADVFKAAWEFNQTLKEGQPRFRIVGLSVKQNYKYMTQMEDVENPGVIQKVYENGIPDVYLADVIQKEFIDRNKKALIYAHMHTGFTRFKYQEYAEKMQKLGFTEVKKAGQLIYDKIGSRVMNILIHAPFPSEKNMSGIDYAVKGIMDTAIALAGEKGERTGFYTSAEPIASLPFNSEVYAKGYGALTLKDFCDAYLILAPLKKMTAATPIVNFVNEKNLQAAIDNFVAAKGRTLTVADFNRFIREDAENLQKALSMF